MWIRKESTTKANVRFDTVINAYSYFWYYFWCIQCHNLFLEPFFKSFLCFWLWQCLSSIKELAPEGKHFWIGLFRDSWKWSDGSNSSFRFWRQTPREPNNRHGKEICVAANFNNDGEWEDWNCPLKRAFICYSGKFSFTLYLNDNFQHTAEKLLKASNEVKMNINKSRVVNRKCISTSIMLIMFMEAFEEAADGSLCCWSAGIVH